MKHGFTLIEVLIAMAIMTAAGCAFVSLIVIAQSIARVQPEAADQQQRARMAVQALAADVARAGAGVDRGAQAGPLGRYFSPLQVAADGCLPVWYVSSRTAPAPFQARSPSGSWAASGWGQATFSTTSPHVALRAGATHAVWPPG